MHELPTPNAPVRASPACRRRLLRDGALLAVVALSASCGSLSPPVGRAEPPVVGTPPSPAESRPGGPGALAVERQWLQSWFDGTPVSIVQRRGGEVAVDVPREHCFEPGKTRIKPALAAVLDKVAQSLRRLPDARLGLLAAPADAQGDRTLAVQRANEVRRHLRARGIPASRLAQPAIADIAAVRLQIDIDD